MLQKVSGLLYVDSDQFWSLAVGKWIVEHGAVPAVETFSWTVEGLPWRSNSWLFCWLLYKVDWYWGMYGVAIMLLAMCLRLNRSNIALYGFVL